MKHLRRLILGMTILAGVLFHIGRLRLTAANLLDWKSFLLVLALGELVLVIGIPRLRRELVVLMFGFWIAIYLLTKYLFFPGLQPLSSAAEAMLSSAEIVLFSLVILLAHKVGVNLDAFEEVIIHQSLAGTKGSLQKLDRSTESIKIEFLRSHRHERPLSIIIVEPKVESIKVNLPHVVEEAQKTLMERYMLAKLGSAISDVVRLTDTVLEVEDGRRFIVLCPETDRTSARTLVQRIQSAAGNGLGISVACGDALLPTYQVSFEEFVRLAEQELKSSNGLPDQPKV